MPIERLSAGDEMMLRASTKWPQHIGALAILDGSSLLDEGGSLRIDVVRDAVASRLDRAPRLRQRIVEPPRGLGPPFWVDEERFDVRDHVRVRSVDAPGGEAELLALVEELRQAPLPADRPLWSIWLLEGLPDRRVGLYISLHHSIADGMAAMTIFGAFLEPIDRPSAEAPPRPGVPLRAPPRVPTSAELLADNVRRGLRSVRAAGGLLRHAGATLHEIVRTWPAMRELLASKPATPTRLNRLVGSDRSIALVRATVDDVRRIAEAHHATSNDVLLALVAGGIRADFVARGARVADITTSIYVPVSLRRGLGRRTGADRGNRVAQMAVPVRLGDPDPRRRLREIAATTSRRRRLPRPALGSWFRGGLLTRLLLRVVARQRVNSTTAYLRGPQGPVSFAGAPLLELFPVVPLIGNVTLGIGVVTYAGTFGIGVVADRATYPDLDALTEGIRADLVALRGEAEAVAAPERVEPVARPAARAAPAGSF